MTRGVITRRPARKAASGRFGGRRRTIPSVGMLMAAIALTLLAGSAATAQARIYEPGPVPSDPENPFNPRIQIWADDNKALASPALNIRVKKPRNRCLKPSKREGFTFLCPQDDTTPGQDNAYEEQDLKKLVFTLPQGIAADPNAAAPCEPVLIVDPNDPRREQYGDYGKHGYWFCENPEPPVIGSVIGDYQDNTCFAFETHTGCGPWDLPEDQLRLKGRIYLAERRPGEQAHLVTFVGVSDSTVEQDNIVRIDTSITVSPSGRITAVTDNIPDFVRDRTNYDFVFAAQARNLIFTLFGETGAARGHPLITNPTSCARRPLVASAQGYAYNVYYDELGHKNPGFGEGKTVTGLTYPYNSTGCNSLPFAPTFDLKVDPPTPGAAPAVTSTITQADGEMTTGKAVVRFPRGFQINFDNQNDQCSDADFAARSCPAGSVVGRAVADSKLLPLPPDPDSGPLKGPVYLGKTDFKAGDIKLLVDISNDFLPGGIRLKGRTTIEAGGTLVATFDNVPELPMKSFELKLFGGKDKSLLLNPKSCGTKNIEATFTSHQRRDFKRVSPVAIRCDKPSFEATLGTRQVRGHPTVSLNAFGSGISAATFTLPRHLKRQSFRRLSTGRSYGTVSFVSGSGGTTDAKLKLMRGTHKGSYFFSATRGGTQIATAQIYQRATVSKKRRSKAKRGGSKARRRAKRRRQSLTRLAIRGLPRDTTLVAVDLFGKRDNFLRNPSRCKYRRKVKGRARGKNRVKLNFRARLTDMYGKPYVLSDAVRVRCKVKKRARGR